jgi:hypothetical protein
LRDGLSGVEVLEATINLSHYFAAGARSSVLENRKDYGNAAAMRQPRLIFRQAPDTDSRYWQIN